MDRKDELVFSYLLDGNGGGTVVGWDDIKHWSPGQGILWVHLNYASRHVQTWLRQDSGLALITCEALLAEDTRPRCVAADDGLLLILRGVNCNPGSDPEDMVSLRMWFEDRRVITMRHRRVMAVEDIHKAIAAGQGPASAAAFLAMVSSRLTGRAGEVIAEIDDKVDELEDTVLTAESYELRSQLAQLRRQTISIRRYIAPQRDVLARLQSEPLSWLDDITRVHIRESAERTARFVEDLDSARDRAAITQEELNSRLAEQMNKTMYLLSIVAAIFLPLSLLTGLLGINVGGIPGAENHLAFLLVCVFLVAIATVQLWIFKRMKWL